jgi:predicted transcriptional regulator
MRHLQTREARELTQPHLANLLTTNQAAVSKAAVSKAAVSKMERRADMYISTLQSILCNP